MTKEEANKFKVPTFKLKMVRDNRGGKPIRCNERNAAHVFAHNIGDVHYEQVWALMLNAKSEIISAVKLSQGGAHGTALLTKDILLPVVHAGAAGFILGHNHPSGDPTPSRQDVELTNAVIKAADTIACPLLDHIVIGFNPDGLSYKSFFNEGLMG